MIVSSPVPPASTSFALAADHRLECRHLIVLARLTVVAGPSNDTVTADRAAGVGDRVEVALPAVQDVGAVGDVVEARGCARRVDLVGARAAARDVVARARIDRVVARAAVDDVVAEPARERVGPGAAADVVRARAAVDGVVGRGARDRVVARAAARALDVAGDRVRLAGLAVVGLAVEHDRHGGRPARVVDRVAAVAARERIRPVCRSALVERVVTVAARDLVVARVAGQRVVAAAARDGVVAGAAVDDVVAQVAGERVVAGAAGEILDVGPMRSPSPGEAVVRLAVEARADARAAVVVGHDVLARPAREHIGR